jgi:pilus assembly protein Flp/PilA
MEYYLRWSLETRRNVHLPKEVQEMFKHLIATLKDEKGQALSEYGLILALVAVVAIGAMTVLGTNVSGVLTTIGNALTAA